MAHFILLYASFLKDIIYLWINNLSNGEKSPCIIFRLSFVFQFNAWKKSLANNLQRTAYSKPKEE